MAESFRQVDGQGLVDEISNLKVGQAVVSVLDEDSKPTYAETVLINPPESKIGTVDPYVRMQKINSSELFEKYGDLVDPESAYEKLAAKKIEDEKLKAQEIQAQEEEKIRAKEAAERAKEEARLAKEKEREAKKEEAAKGKKKSGFFDRFTNKVIGAVGRERGGQGTRGICGTGR